MIPNVFHYCYGMLPDARFGFLEYLAIKSAYEVNRPQRIYLHYQHACSGPWWDKACELVTLRPTTAPTSIFGRPLNHFAHRADVLRLLRLQEEGGIYLDIDTLCLRPFTDLLTQQCVMAWQGRHGLCNAVLLSEPRGAFINAWVESYREFRATGYDRYWDEHSVLVPARLARDPRYRPHLTILDRKAFFFPLWTQMRFLFKSNDLSLFRGSYCIHYWETVCRKWLEQITPENAVAGDTNFARFVRRVLQPEHHVESIDPPAESVWLRRVLQFLRLSN